ncbi:MAG TPA: hypothetical protein PKH31_02870, partial [Candidatus Sumerlaeota bacterium]|nr:hypothetical protein [Candidatus Sumerlaeota bacterium]
MNEPLSQGTLPGRGSLPVVNYSGQQEKASCSEEVHSQLSIIHDPAFSRTTGKMHPVRKKFIINYQLSIFHCPLSIVPRFSINGKDA